MLKILKGFRTYVAAVLIAIEPLLTAAVTNANLSLEILVRQIIIAAVIVALRTVTTTAPGRRE